jgi:putative endonuclease
MKKAYTYLVECSDGSLYCGWTNDLDKRISDHNAGKGAKYTKPRLPVKLVYFEAFDTKEEAMSREWHIKQMPREKKLKLISDFPVKTVNN